MARRVPEADWSEVARPVLERGGMPLRVAVYQALARAIRAGSPEPGSLLPVEADLCTSFGVSRTVMREALILLEEDGLVRTRRGVGRFVVDKPPQMGLEWLQPLEQLLRHHDRPATVRPLKRVTEVVTEFSARGLDLPDEGVTWFWESLYLRDDEPIALSQEWIPAGTDLTERSHTLAGAISGAADTPSSLLAFITDRLGGGALGPATCEVSISLAGPERGELFTTPGDEPILVLSQNVMLDGRPLYVGKHMLRGEAGHVLVVQSVQG